MENSQHFERFCFSKSHKSVRVENWLVWRRAIVGLEKLSQIQFSANRSTGLWPSRDLWN